MKIFQIVMYIALLLLMINSNASPLAYTIAKVCSEKTTHIIKINKSQMSDWEAGNLHGTYMQTGTARSGTGKLLSWSMSSVFIQKNDKEGYCVVNESGGGHSSRWCRFVQLKEGEIRFSYHFSPCKKKW